MEDEVCDMQIRAHGCAHACASMPTEGTLAARNMCAHVHKQVRTKLTLTQKGLLHLRHSDEQVSFNQAFDFLTEGA